MKQNVSKRRGLVARISFFAIGLAGAFGLSTAAQAQTTDATRAAAAARPAPATNADGSPYVYFSPSAQELVGGNVASITQMSGGVPVVILTPKDLQESNVAAAEAAADRVGFNYWLDFSGRVQFLQNLSTGNPQSWKLGDYRLDTQAASCLVIMPDPESMPLRDLMLGLAGLYNGQAEYLPGAEREWWKYILMHELRHCAQPLQGLSSIPTARVLYGETDADQGAFDRLFQERIQAGDPYNAEMNAWARGARAMSSMHLAGAVQQFRGQSAAFNISIFSHATAAGLRMPGEPVPRNYAHHGIESDRILAGTLNVVAETWYRLGSATPPTAAELAALDVNGPYGVTNVLRSIDDTMTDEQVAAFAQALNAAKAAQDVPAAVALLQANPSAARVVAFMIGSSRANTNMDATVRTVMQIRTQLNATERPYEAAYVDAYLEGVVALMPQRAIRLGLLQQQFPTAGRQVQIPGDNSRGQDVSSVRPDRLYWLGDEAHQQHEPRPEIRPLPRLEFR